MHYRTERIGFLEPADGFLSQAANVHNAGAATFDTGELPSSDGPLVEISARRSLRLTPAASPGPAAAGVTSGLRWPPGVPAC